MTLILKDVPSNRKDYGRHEDGTYPSRVVQVIDFGIQKQTDWKTGEETDPKPRLMVTFETPNEVIEIEDAEGNVREMPRWIGREYTISTFEQAGLMKLIAALKPDAESFDEILNLPCMIQVGTTSGGKAKVTQVMAMPKGVPVGELANEPTFFDFDNPNQELFESLPTWQRKKIKEALNYNGFADMWSEERKDADKSDNAASDDDFDDDVPF
jgi:hypothetical protein